MGRPANDRGQFGNLAFPVSIQLFGLTCPGYLAIQGRDGKKPGFFLHQILYQLLVIPISAIMFDYRLLLPIMFLERPVDYLCFYQRG